MSSLQSVKRAVKPVAGSIRRNVPDALVPALMRTRLKRAYKNPKRWELARQQMTWLLGAVSTEEEIEAAARRYIERDVMRSELRYHPKLITYMPVDGVEHLVEARSRGKGVVLSFLHHGHYEGFCASVARAEQPLVMLVSPEMLAKDRPEFLKQHLLTGTISGNTVLDASLGMKAILPMFERGEVVGIATDVAGRTSVQFLGQERLGSFGAALIAQKTGAPVVCATAHPDDEHYQRVKLSEPLDPADYASPEDLLKDMLAHQEVAVLAWPEAYHQPTLRWGVLPKDEAPAG